MILLSAKAFLRVNQSNGQVDLRYNPESILEDFFIPVRGDRGSRIETLPGGENAAAIEDIQYLQADVTFAYRSYTIENLLNK